MRRLIPMGVFAALMAATACQTGETFGAPALLVLSSDSAVVLVDSTMAIHALAEDAAGHSLTVPVSWSVADTSIARVDDSGLVTGRGLGTTELIAVSDTLTSRIQLRVAQRFTQVAVGRVGACALGLDGYPYCWGVHNDSPKLATRVRRFTQLSVGLSNVCGLDAAHEVLCWDLLDTASATIVVPATFDTLMDNGIYTCGISTAAKVLCLGGDNNIAQGIRPTPASPVEIFAGLGVHTVGLGFQHLCGTNPAGRLWCVGVNDFGQGAVPTVSAFWAPCNHPCNLTPVETTPPGSLLQISGGEFTCALTSTGVAWCWGGNWMGELGSTASNGCYATRVLNASSPCSDTPVAVSGSHHFRLISSSTHTCGLEADGAPWCWGPMTGNEAGNGTTSNTSAYSVPVQAASGMRFSSIDVAEYGTCGLALDKRVYCWGSDSSGILGNGPAGDSNVPTPILFQP